MDWKVRRLTAKFINELRFSIIGVEGYCNDDWENNIQRHYSATEKLKH